MMPPTPLQNSNDTFKEEQGRFEVEDQRWSAKERTIIARTKQYLEESHSVRTCWVQMMLMWVSDES